MSLHEKNVCNNRCNNAYWRKKPSLEGSSDFSYTKITQHISNHITVMCNTSTCKNPLVHCINTALKSDTWKRNPRQNERTENVSQHRVLIPYAGISEFVEYILCLPASDSTPNKGVRTIHKTCIRTRCDTLVIRLLLLLYLSQIK